MSECRYAKRGREYGRRSWLFALAFQVFALSSVVALCSLLALAQSGAGAITGRVADPSGLNIVGAEVQAVNATTDTVSTVETNNDGLYSFPSLLPGTYRITVTKEGFDAVIQPAVELHVADALSVNFTLQVGSVAQSVTVTSEVPVVNTENSSLGALVNADRMVDLPLNGRNYVDLVTIQAGVNIDAEMASSTQSGANRGTFFTVDGATPRSNNYTLDGAIVVNTNGGGTSSESGTTLGVDGIQEFKVVTGTFGAEYGSAMGGQVNMVSKGGGNQLHGDVFEYLRNSDLDARNFFDYGYQTPGAPRLPHLERNNFGGSLGGPIRKNKTFVYGVYEGLRLLVGQTVLDNVPNLGCHGAAGTVVTPATCPLVTTNTTISTLTAPLLALYPNPNVGTNEYTLPSPEHSQVDWGQIRIDHNISATDTLFGRYTSEASDLIAGGSGINSNAGTVFPQYKLGEKGRDQSTTIAENHGFSSNLLNSARISYSRTHYYENVIWTNGIASLTGPQYSFATGQPLGQFSISGQSTFGASTNLPQYGINNYYQLNDDLFYSKGKHALKFGFAGIKYDIGTQFAAGKSGTVAFSNFTNFLKAVPSSWSGLANIATANSSRNFMYYTFGFYAQDDWHLTPRLTANLGLRYEFMTQPNETDGAQYGARDVATNGTLTPGPIIAPQSKHDFSPRIGFAYDVFGNGKTSVRGGFGIYYDIGNLSALILAGQTGEPPLTVQGTHNNTLNPQPFTLPFTFQPSELGSYTLMDYNWKTPHMLKWTLTVEQQLPGELGLSVTYDGTRGLNTTQVTDGNPSTPAAFVNGVPFWNGLQPLENPLIPHMATFEESGGSSKYDAMLIQLNKHLTHGLQFQADYTWSHLLNYTESQKGTGDCTGNVGMSSVMYPNNPNLFDYGPACYDLTQTFRFNALYHFHNIKADNFAAKLLHGWWTGVIYSFNTGYPFMPTLSTQRDQSGNLGGSTDRPNEATVADAAACPALSSTCKIVPVPYNSNTVITGNPQQWFNPNMFVLTPMEQTPGGALCTKAPCYGTLGDVGRGILRGPHLSEPDLSLVKDTRLPFLGEQGNLEFRTEVFNIVNRPNFAMPSIANFSGSPSDISPYAEAPTGTAGRITSTFTTSRQLQFALRVIF